jgi:hypothetical protein
MKSSSFLRSYRWGIGLVWAALATACGTKPDGTPYGTDPAKLPEGRRKAQATTTIYQTDVPKGAELNAVTNAARAGQPTSAAASAR